MAGSEFPDEKPPAPDFPDYLLNPLEKQPPATLDDVAEYSSKLAAWKRGELEREAERIRKESEKRKKELRERDISDDPDDYEAVPSGAYVTIKTTKQTGERSYQYYYWQWREGDSWENEYIAPVNPRR